MALVALIFWIGIFYGFFRVLGYFQAAEGFGHILAHKLMGMLWLTLFSVLLFSNVVTALSAFFLSKDLETLHAAPVAGESLFWSRFTMTLADSSWMVFFFGLPVFLAYGLVYRAGLLYYLKLAAVSAPFLVLATSLAVMFVMLLVNVFPARRTKDILFLLAVALVILLYLTFRFIRPERLVNPNEFANVAGYLASLRTPGSPFLPSHWATEALWPGLIPDAFAESGFYLAILASTAAAAAVMASFLAAWLYPSGFSKSQEGARRFITRHPVDALVHFLGKRLHPASGALVTKEIKTFFRDNTQWSQLLLLVALIVIYLYNFSVLDLGRYPLRIFWLQNVIAFLNIGLAAFVVASLAVRFVFPAVSQEGFSYWIIRSSPLSLKRFLWTKYLLFAPPLVVVAEVLIVLSNQLLNVTPSMMAVSTITVFFLVLGLVGLGVGLGGVYPRFEAENMTAVATGFGGLVFMVLSALYVALVIVLEAYPVITLLRFEAQGAAVTPAKAVLMAVCFLAVMGLNLAAVFLPMRLGRLRLKAREAEE
jgi:ABC-2 type transport system permease protein